MCSEANRSYSSELFENSDKIDDLILNSEAIRIDHIRLRTIGLQAQHCTALHSKSFIVPAKCDNFGLKLMGLIAAN